MLLIIIMYALLSSSFTLGKVLLGHATPMFLTGIRMTIAGIILLTYQYFAHHKHFTIQKKQHLWYFAQMIILGVFASYSLRFWALKYMASFKAAFIYNLSPFFAALYSYLFFREKMTRLKWAGLGIGLVGLIPVLIGPAPDEAILGQWFSISWPECAAIASIALHSYSWTIVQKLVKLRNYPPALVNGTNFTFGGIIALIASYFFETFTPITQLCEFCTLLITVIIVSNIICYNMYGYLLKRYSATLLSFAGFLSPLFAAVWGRFFLRETITWHFYVSCAVVAIGLYIFYRSETTKKTEGDATDVV